jgi:hypothetical protein
MFQLPDAVGGEPILNLHTVTMQDFHAPYFQDQISNEKTSIV